MSHQLPPNNTNAASAGRPSSVEPNAEMLNNRGEFPFLVTHYLANYGAQNGEEVNDPQRKAALERLQKATAEIASAFASLGAYGTSFRPSFGASFSQQSLPQNAAYSDMSRQWSGLSPSHLENLGQVVATSNNAVDVTATNSSHANLFHAAGESTEPKPGQGGRTLLDAINVEESRNDESEGAALSILHAPALVTSQSNKANDEETVHAERSSSPLPVMHVKSSYSDVAEKTAESMRQFLTFRENIQSTQNEIRSLQFSVSKQEAKLNAWNAKFTAVATQNLEAVKKLEMIDEVVEGRQGCERVITQLRRKLSDLYGSNATKARELARLESEAKSWEARRRAFMRGFRDPFGSWRGTLANGNRIGGNYTLRTVIGRQEGMSRSRLKPYPYRSAIKDGSHPTHFSSTRKTLLCSRLSHKATINTHLSYPVYCLRFDRTGRYFITGADDYLIKVFYLGAGQSCRTKNSDGNRLLRCNYGANHPGALHVSSLRGHAGVINDIDVSSDNCFLATASVDGDVRIWGLRDGCPVAMLRGHKGGANMVSWSTLTPYRVVTTGSDGFARVWDIREACLKRYGALIGKRQEYRLRLTASEKKAESEDRSERRERTPSEALLPPLPAREGSVAPSAGEVPSVSYAANSQQSNNSASASSPGRVIVPSIPVGVPPLPGADANLPEQNAGGGPAPNGGEIDNIVPGQFIANDLMDEGVKLLCKHKHGTTGEDLTGPGTRSRRAAVNVICVSRCPLGGHFTTGSDDGICRVWEDGEDDGVAIVDRRAGGLFSLDEVSGLNQKRLRSASSEAGPLLTLLGHMSAITDLAYSHTGDRILSASQKDGVFRIWSLGMNVKALAGNGKVVGDRGVSRIVIKLTDPSCSTKPASKSSRRGPGSSVRKDTSKVSCDVAVWCHDDSRIITSQSVLLKQSGSEIQPGSQFLFLWDSGTGQCLMGVSGAHTMQCPVVIPHPFDSSLVCTAAADGLAKLWDWETGRCMFTHRNKVEFGPVEAADRNKLAGFLDGAFSPDGTTIVLTDDKGRITILDSSETKRDSEVDMAWTREQYFANDYYELFYDRDGYCIERGSERPPHLAPRGVRCNHSGSPWSDEVNEAFRGLLGPMPLAESDCTWRRERLRAQARMATGSNVVGVEGRHARVRRGVREFDPLSTIIIKASGHVEEGIKQAGSISSQVPTNGQANPERGSSRGNDREASSSRSLSANFRWRDYEDLIREQGVPDEEVDSDDEEFEPVARNASHVNNSDESDEDLEVDEGQRESPQRRGGRRSETSGVERQRRAQRRSTRRDTQFVELGSDDEMVAQFMSTNNTPSGPYIRDYTVAGHFWRMPSTGRVRRKWLCRHESDSSYEGRKTYTPQLGDSVVYIPRAHFETIKEFPSLTPPWQRWPQGAVWPVVRCSVRGIRFRFPYEDYFRRGQTTCDSIVAILTLEVTGIPELSDDREFPWPKPSFVQPTRPNLFELSIFENDKCEYLFPEGQYVGRLQSLERAVQARRMKFRGIKVNTYYEDRPDAEDGEMQVYAASIESLGQEDECSDAHLRGSGFDVLNIMYPDQDYKDSFSPWELGIEGTNFSRPTLTDDDKKNVLENLNIQLRNSNISEYFSLSVDTARYSDYSKMVEIERNLMFVKRRLDENYYASKLSVVADLRLIRDNCIKYNTTANEMSRIACEMCDGFEQKVLSNEERSQIISEEEFESLVGDRGHGQSEAENRSSVRVRLRMRGNQSVNETQVPINAQDLNASAHNLRERGRTSRQSSLESLPQPQAPTGRRMSLRSEIEAASGQRRTTRSRESNPSTEVLGRISRSRSRRLGDISYVEQTSEFEEGNNDTNPASAMSAIDESDDDDRKPSANSSVASNSSGAGQPSSEDDDDGSNHDLGQPTDHIVTRRSRRRTKKTYADEDSSEDVEEDEDEPEEYTARSATRRSRPAPQTESRKKPRTRRGSNAHDDSEHESADSSAGFDSERHVSTDDEEVGSASHPTRSSSRKNSSKNQQQQTVRTSPRSKRKLVAASPGDSPQRRSGRSCAKNHSSYEEVASDFEPPDGESEDESDESSEHVAASRGRSRRVPAYEELPSDFEDGDEFSEKEEVAARQSGRSSRKRQQDGSHERSVASKRTKREDAKQPPNQLPNQLPKLNKWPEIELKEITLVAKALLSIMIEADTDAIFRVPVVESHPGVKLAYIQVIDNPMDLRTIAEDRIVAYESIQELQDDLVLMFQNSCKFNQKSTAIWDYTVTLWNKTNMMFIDACKEVGALLPRRWLP